MTKSAKDYSKSVIYKIVCKDENIKSCYVGSTSNLLKRSQRHKSECNLVTGPKYMQKKYVFIRNHGGWGNWKIEIVEYCNVSNKFELEERENDWYELLGADLNMNRPTSRNRTPEIYFCDCGSSILNTPGSIRAHNETPTHQIWLASEEWNDGETKQTE